MNNGKYKEKGKKERRNKGGNVQLEI